MYTLEQVTSHSCVKYGVISVSDNVYVPCFHVITHVIKALYIIYVVIVTQLDLWTVYFDIGRLPRRYTPRNDGI